MPDPSPDVVLNNFNLRTAIIILKRNFWLIVVSLICTFAAAVAYLFLAPPKYTSTAVILVDPRQEQIIQADRVIASGPGLDSPVIDSEVELIRSAVVAERVIRKLDLINSEEFKRKSFLAGLIQTVSLNSEEEDKPENRRTELKKTIDLFLKNLSVRRRGLSYVIDVSFTSSNADQSALITNTIVNSYIDDQLDAKYASTKRARAWLSDRLDSLQASVRNAETAVEEYRAEQDLIITAGGTNPYDKQLEEINNQLIAARVEVVERKLKMERRTPSSELKKDYQIALSRQETLEGAFADLSDGAAERERAAIRLRELERQAEASRNLYEAFLTRYKEATEQQSLQSADSRIISSALPSEKPSSPKKSWVFLIAMVVGAGAGTSLSLLREHMDDSIRTADDVTANLDTGYFTMVPEISKANMTEIQTGESLSLMQDNLTSYLDSVRSIFFTMEDQILRSKQPVSGKIVTITSSEPDEGKTTIAVTIAKYAAFRGMRTLLIDGDLKAASASRRLGFEIATPGLIEVLTNDIPPSQVIGRIEGEENLHVICADRDIPNAVEVLSSARMDSLVMSLRENYDLIVIDTAPVARSLETRHLVQLADNLVFVLLWGSTSARLVKTTLDLLNADKNAFTSVVLNRVNFKKLRQYAAYGSSYSHS